MLTTLSITMLRLGKTLFSERCNTLMYWSWQCVHCVELFHPQLLPAANLWLRFFLTQESNTKEVYRFD